MKKIAALVIAFILMVSLLSACVHDSADDSKPDDTANVTAPGPVDYLSADYVYTSEVIPFPLLPDGKTYIDNIVLAGNVVYFTARNIDENADDKTSALFAMDIDGSNFKELPNYKPGSFPADITNAIVYISSMHVDNEGNLWVAETRSIDGSDMPDGFGTNLIRKLDNTGEETAAFDVSDLPADEDYIYVYALNTDDEENIYAASFSTIYVLNNQGSLLFTLDFPDFFKSFVSLSDGRVAYVEQQSGGELSLYLKVVDVESKAWGETIGLPSNVWRSSGIFPGNNDYLYLFNDNNFLNGVSIETGNQVQVFNWAGNNLSSDDITGITLLPDRRIAAARLPLSAGGNISLTELVLLTPVPALELPDRIILKLATFWFGSDLRHVVEQFNRKSTTHRIDVIDYSTFNSDEDWRLGLLRLNTEMITGNRPDILDIRFMPIQNYASKGLLVDLYPFLDADPELSRDDLLENLLIASEIDGSLYRLIPAFELITMFGNPGILGDYPGWTVEEFLDVILDNPQAERPIGNNGTKMALLSFLILNNMDEYIDIQSGTAFFDNDDFIKLLEVANTFPAEIDYNISKFHAVPDGRQIMDAGRIGLLDFQINRVLFGGELILKGFPTKERDGNVLSPYTNLAITISCEEPDVAWEFIRMYLQEDIQRDIIPNWLFPMSKYIFEEVITKKIPIGGGVGASDGIGELHLKAEEMNLTDDEIDYLRSIILNSTRIVNDDRTILDMVQEGASDFFNGRNTAADAARIIQNRVTIYLSEQAG